MHGGEVENTDGDFVVLVHESGSETCIALVTEDEAEKGLGSSVGLHIQKEEMSDILCLLNKTL